VANRVEPLSALPEQFVAARLLGPLEIADVNHEGELLPAHLGEQVGKMHLLEPRVRCVAERAERKVCGVRGESRTQRGASRDCRKQRER
jgi:hypothetical protein